MKYECDALRRRLISSLEADWPQRPTDYLRVQADFEKHTELQRLFPLDTSGPCSKWDSWQEPAGAIALARDDKFHARTKHIDIRFHFIRFAVEEKKIRLVYCPTDDMTTDTLTKALPSAKAKHFAAAMGLAKA